jgi:hypothetical protein
MSFEESGRPPVRPGKIQVRLTGRPSRLKVIGKEDQLDLRIILETCKSVEDFLSHVN